MKWIIGAVISLARKFYFYVKSSMSTKYTEYIYIYIYIYMFVQHSVHLKALKVKLYWSFYHEHLMSWLTIHSKGK